MSNFSISFAITTIASLLLIPKGNAIRHTHTRSREIAIHSRLGNHIQPLTEADALSHTTLPQERQRQVDGILFQLGDAVSETDSLLPPSHTQTTQLLLPPPDSTLNPNDRIGDATTQPYVSPMWLKNPTNLETKYELTPDGKGYFIYEQIGGINVRPPSYISLEDYIALRREKGVGTYFKELSLNQNNATEKSLIPSIELAKINDVFGGGPISITPTGNATLSFSLDRNVTANPALPIRQQRNQYFNFDQQFNVGVVGQIGDKMKINISQDTRATFDFENLLKLDYTGNEDQILQRLESGNVSLPLGNSLIQGAQNLFGIKAGLKFGPVNVTAIGSIDRGQRQTINVKGNGVIETPFKKSAADYDQNRHFFLSHFFRSKYDEALGRLPQINSRIRINQVEIWVSNPNLSQTSNLRPGIGFIDMGENNIPIANGKGVVFNDKVVSNPTKRYPDKEANNLYDYLKNNPDLRDKAKAATALENSAFQMVNGVDFQLVNLRKLQETKDYTYHQQLGYVSMSSPLQSDDVLFVSYSYTIDGVPYQVGEFSNDFPANATNSNPIFLKMLRPAQLRPTYNNKKFPVWDLMMKNVYSISYGLRPDGFKMQISYESGTKAGKINFLPSGAVKNVPLLQVMDVDNLTNNTAPQADFIFDFIEGLTVISDKGYVIFPHIEPFGTHLANQLKNDPNEVGTYVFQPLYDMTYQDAIQKYPHLNRYALEGTYQGGGSNNNNGMNGQQGNGGAEIPINAIGVNPQSVSVTANGIRLTPGVDYDVDPSGSKVIIKNPAYLQQGQNLSVNVDQQQQFQMQTKTLTGARAEYNPLPNTKLGLSMLTLNERPSNFKTTIGDEPLRNTLWGLDVNTQNDLPWVTKTLDKLPLFSTKAPSKISFTGEAAQFRPGLPRQVQQDSLRGITYIDDFEAVKMPYNMMGMQRWRLASFPRYQPASRLYDPLTEFPTDTLARGYSRAKLAWYQIDPQLYNNNIAQVPQADKYASYTRQIGPKEIFPQATVLAGTQIQNTFDLHYYPSLRGPYNYQTDPGKIDATGRFLNPRENWAGIMSDINTNTDFEAQNVEFIEFWLMSPFLDEFEDSTGGELIINLGNISEDVTPDNLQFFENGLPTDPNNASITRTPWGLVPNTIPPSNAFSNANNAREAQDIGFDGLKTADEVSFFAPYVQKMQNNFGANSQAYLQFLNDPSTDDYIHFLDPQYESRQAGIIDRYNLTFGSENNSPINQQAQGGFTLQGNQNPDTEDLNRNGTPNMWEEYWEYRIKISKDSLKRGMNYIVDEFRNPKVCLNSSCSITDDVTWYQFRIPIKSGRPVNNIPNFKVINTMRMYLTNFQEEAILRMTEFQLVATQWRKYEGALSASTPSPFPSEPPFATFDVGSVSIQENSKRLPFNYLMPPGVFRQGFNGNTQPGFQQDERSLVLRMCGLQDGDGRAVFKNVNQDFRNFKRLRMWVHAEANEDSGVPSNFTQRGDATAFIRVGLDNDFNYYEYEIPLSPSDPTLVADTLNTWRNQFNFALDALTQAKDRRNKLNFNVFEVYEDTIGLPLGHKIRIKGTPKLSDVRTLMTGVRNPKDGKGDVCLEVWMNELSLSSFDQTNAWAGNGSVNFTLADLGTVQGTMQYRQAGFGTLDQHAAQRTREDMIRYSVAGDFTLNKFLPQKWGINLPLHVNQDEQFLNPVFDPREADVKTKDLYKSMTPTEVKETKTLIQDYTRNRGFSFNNIKKNKVGGGKSHIWDISNFDASFAYSEQLSRNYLTERKFNNNYQGAINYRYNIKSPNIQPFKKWKHKNPLSEFNFSPLPKSVQVSVMGNRLFTENVLRPTAFGGATSPVYTKNFIITRQYSMAWDLTKSLAINFNATTNGRVDEVKGYWKKASQQERDSIGNFMDNILHFGRDTVVYDGVDSLGNPYSYQKVFNRQIQMGRTINYQHSLNVAYTLPFSKFKPTDWITGNATYAGTFQWQNPPEAYQSLGATVVNGQNIAANGRLDFNGLYGKWKPLKKLLDPLPAKPLPPKPKPGDPKAPVKPETKPVTPPKTNPNWKDGHKLHPPAELKFLKALLRSTLRLIFSLKNVDASLTQTAGTTLPGYLPVNDNMGLDFNYIDTTTGKRSFVIPPSLGFVAGMQDDIRKLAGNNYWITKDTTLSNFYSNNVNTQLTLKANIEPIPGFKIDLNATRNFNENSSEMFRWDNQTFMYNATDQQFSGNYTISYIFANTAFKSGDENFAAFGQARKEISQRLYDLNPAKISLAYQGDVDGYKNGYLGTSQDVLLPALLAGYGALGADKVSTSPFPKVPLPNWNINFNPVIAFPDLKQTFSSISVKHTYRGTYTVGSYNRNLNALDSNGDGLGDNTILVGTDPFGNQIENFNAVRNITTVQITEQFSPLIGVTSTLKNGMNINVSYNRGRQMSFNVGNLQLTEDKSQDFSFTLGYRKDKLNWDIRMFGRDIALKNTLNANCQVTIRDSRQRNKSFDGTQNNLDLRGSMIVNINPYVDYTVNNRLSIRAFWQQNITKPYTSLSYKNSFRSAGIQIRFALQ